MHPLVYYAIVEFDRNEMVRNVELERQHRELRERQQLERQGVRVGHGQVQRARRPLRVRWAAALGIRWSAPAGATNTHTTGGAAGRPVGTTAAIGCRA